MTTMRDVASRARVSVKTVSRVFNDDPHVLPETRERVESALAELNYTPNMLARTFRDGRSRVIGVAVPNLADPFFSAIAKGVEDVARARDLSVLVSSLGDDPGREAELMEAMLRRQLGGIVMAPVARDQSYLQRWALKVPFVFVDRPPVGLEADTIVEDDFGGAAAATRHLLDRGHRAVAFVGDSAGVPTVSSRLEGYRSALREAGVEPDDDLVVLTATTPEAAAAAVGRLRSAVTPPTAVFSADAQTTMVLVPALAGSAWALTAFGDFPMASMLSPALTVVDQDPAALGRRAGERVMLRMEDESLPVVRTTLGVRLLERDSARPEVLEALGGLFPRSRAGADESVVWTSPDPA